MVAQKKQTEYVTTNALDTAMDAGRVYAETLFTNSARRVDEVIENKLKEALAKIRPEPSMTPARPPEPVLSIAARNSLALQRLTKDAGKLAFDYQMETGLRVRHIVFGVVGNRLIARPVVSNV
jgi:hypothetical protein